MIRDEPVTCLTVAEGNPLPVVHSALPELAHRPSALRALRTVLRLLRGHAGRHWTKTGRRHTF